MFIGCIYFSLCYETKVLLSIKANMLEKFFLYLAGSSSSRIQGHVFIQTFIGRHFFEKVDRLNQKAGLRRKKSSVLINIKTTNDIRNTYIF